MVTLLEHRASGHEAGGDLELRMVLGKLGNDLGGRRSIFPRVGHTDWPRESVHQACALGVLHRELRESVLDDPIATLTLPNLRPELDHVGHVHAGVIRENQKLCAVEELRQFTDLLGAQENPDKVDSNITAPADATETPLTDGSDTWINWVNEKFGKIVAHLAPILFWEVPFLTVPLIVLVLLTGSIFFTLYHGFLNFRGFKHAIDITRGKYDNPDDEGDISE